MRFRTALPLCALVLVAGCSSDKKASQADVQNAVAHALASQAAAASAAAAPTHNDAVAPVDTTPAAEANTTSGGDSVDFVMPNFVGMNLQDAQDKVQTLGVFYSVSHDLLGSRHQVVDSNWQVCNQSPAAGTRIKGKASDYEGKVDFGSVKLTESCP